MPQCKFSLYLKKAGLASRNIVHLLKKSFYVVSVFALIIIIKAETERGTVVLTILYERALIGTPSGRDKKVFSRRFP